jgi:hypothetical protein
MRHLLFGLAAALAVGSTLAGQPAQAQGLSVTFSTGSNPTYVPVRPAPIYRPARVYEPAPFYNPAPAYRRPRYERRAHYRPAPRPHCFVRMERSWDGWAWREQPVRICR